jgi:serine protease Do
MRMALRSVLLVAVSLLLLTALAPAATAAGEPPKDNPFAAIVGLHAKVPSEARSARSLGRERDGSGIVIDSSGLVVTIGYLMIEASEITLDIGGRRVPASFVAYDHDSGFGLVRAVVPISVKPMALGSTSGLKPGDPLIAASQGGIDAAMPVKLAAKERYAASWEYMLDEALFTTPPHPLFGGAALMDREAKLVGIGSLILQTIPGAPRQPGNLWVPIDRLKPLLGDLLALGRSSAPPRPWLGINAAESTAGIVVALVSRDGPAEAAGLRKGDVITAIGGTRVADLARFYKLLWESGPAGSDIPLTVRQGSDTRQLTIHSVDRLSFLKLKPTL